MVSYFVLKQHIRRLATAAKPSKWTSVVGLEIHAQIQSQSKLFSGSRVSFGSPVNSCVSPFDASIPGTLPVLNRACVEAGVKTALALSANVHPISMFDRKHYFYADSPAGYQITQQRAPLATGGQLTCHVYVPGVTKKPYTLPVRLHQLQLEQDSGKSLHDIDEGKSLVDLNRAGVPLMELVFEPDLSNGEEAAALVKELCLILTRLGTCSCRMEEGALRVDANISIHQAGQPFGTRTEVKNIGSVRGVADAIGYEIRRQIELVDGGGVVHNETRSWDAQHKCTVAMRDKEVLQDYRFMPEPNLPPLHLHVGEGEPEGMVCVEKIRNEMPELPEQTRTKLSDEFALGWDVAVILMNEPTLLEYFYEIRRHNADAPNKLIVNVLINDFLMLCHKNKIDVNACNITPSHMSDLIGLLQNETINLILARLVLQEMLISPDQSPKSIIDRNDWYQISDPETIAALCADVIAANPKMVDQYKRGKTKILYGLAGEIVKRTQQRANMTRVIETLTEQLSRC